MDLDKTQREALESVRCKFPAGSLWLYRSPFNRHLDPPDHLYIIRSAE
jgi:hypothetical protein